MQTHKTVVLVIEGLLSPLGEESFLKGRPGFTQFASVSTVGRIAPVPEVEAPEALWLGMSPLEGQLRQGPLTVAALGVDPPERSTHFHLNLLSLEGTTLGSVTGRISRADEETLWTELTRLNTKLLTLVRGEQVDHGLVWERLTEMRTVGASEVLGKSHSEHLPEGDGENQIRRFVDDSVNLLSELELNARRIDSGLSPISIAWPWGNGVRIPLKNMSLVYGEPIWVESASLRLQGLSRLVGLRHGRRSDVGTGLQTRLEWMASAVNSRGATIEVVSVPAELRRAEMWEELGWFAREF